MIAGFACLGIDPAISLAVWLGGLIFVYGFGIFVELINNVLDIKKILNKMCDNGYSMGAPTQSQYNNPSRYVQNGNNTGFDGSKLAAAAEKVSADKADINGGWLCKTCGTVNTSSSRICMGCGMEKYGNSVSRPVQHRQSAARNQYAQGGNVQHNVSSSKMNLADVAASAAQDEIKTGWYCRSCGTKNKASSRICRGCGKEK